MREFLVCSAIGLAACAVIYGLASFAALSVNPADWAETKREGLAALWAVFGPAVALIAAAIRSDAGGS